MPEIQKLTTLIRLAMTTILMPMGLRLIERLAANQV